MQTRGYPPAGQKQIRIEIETPRPCNLRIENAHGTSRRAARIRKSLSALLFLRLVQIFESAPRHDDFAAHFEICRHAQFFQLRRIPAKRDLTCRAELSRG